MRKRPAQQRSRDMVATLLDAAARVVVERGLDNLTTNHVAEAAGVSIGSLYQYFDDKDALIEALMQRHTAELLVVVDGRLRELIDADARAITRGILEAVFDVVENDPCRRELVRHWDRLRTRSTLRALEQHMTEACRMYVMRHHEQYRVENLPAALFVGINSLHYTVAHYLSLENPVLRRAEVIGALSDMLAAYLLSGETKKAARRRPSSSRVKQS
ncbi:TetR/AcrR family transcriptional regulator [Solimonas sp. K1W22B-7]|uniref:TetR/AcrR family transcriptional regulator n=1 Tax=Solimonas sp. K1W22B-7 TaxID=2303331 RepID=UPI0013C50E1D|nr:TetR/AcrR family transcriptional regulator [Solimonas sp. K1W22B-7]